MYAVIRTGGKQYRVAKDDVIRVEKIAGAAGDPVAFADVLAVTGAGEPAFGTPLVEGATVTGEVVEQGRAKKIIVFKKKRRKGYRRTHGHRQDVTVVRITDILTGGAKPKAKPAAKPAPANADPAARAETATVPAGTDAAAAKADDLKKISGLGPVLQKKLNGLGVTTFAQIAAWTEADIERVDAELNFKGRITREDWVGQAKALAKGAES
jgi:large subunit ribosomal protein L21